MTGGGRPTRPRLAVLAARYYGAPVPLKRPKILPSLRVSRKRRTEHHVGEAPGTIRIDPEAEKPSIRGLGYSPDDYEETVLTLEQIPAFVDKWPIAWIDVVGLGDADVIKGIGEHFHLHPLALEDVAHAHERAKIEVYEEYLFIVSRMAHREEAEVFIEQLSTFFGEGWIVSFQETEGDCLEPVRNRIRHGRGRIRRMAADYLAYALLDALTDAYFPILDGFSDVMERLEDRIIGGETEDVTELLHGSKRELIPIRRAVTPLRDVVKFLRVEPHKLISDQTRLYLRDVDDHLTLIVEQLDSLRDLASSLMDVHYNIVSHRMNEVMKVLTVMSTIFIPLSFVVGLYGMNFDTTHPLNLPELGWQYGYLAVWAVMLTMVGGMLVFFRRKGWF